MGVGGDSGTHRAVGLAVPGPTPLANQKNVLLIVPVALALGLPFQPTTPAVLAFPSLAVVAWLSLTGRLEQGRPLVLDGPKEVWKGADVSGLTHYLPSTYCQPGFC